MHEAQASLLTLFFKREETAEHLCETAKSSDDAGETNFAF